MSNTPADPSPSSQALKRCQSASPIGTVIEDENNGGGSAGLGPAGARGAGAGRARLPGGRRGQRQQPAEAIALAGWSLCHGLASLHADGLLTPDTLPLSMDNAAAALVQMLLHGVAVATPAT